VMLLSRQFASLDCRCRARIGRKIRNASAFPQVTALALKPLKIVKVFEFMPLSCAPDRIRTCAHGSGEGCCVRLWPAETCSQVSCPGA
jgi:hypothetical protein